MKGILIAAVLLAFAGPAMAQQWPFMNGPPSIYPKCDADAHGTCRRADSAPGLVHPCAQPFAGSVTETYSQVCRNGLCVYALASDGDVPRMLDACGLAER